MKGKIRGRRKAPLRDSFFSSHSKNFSLKEWRQINNPNYTKLLTLPVTLPPGISIVNNLFVQHLIEHGVTEGKSTRFIPALSDWLMPHYIRGLFDGDGSIVIRKAHTYGKAMRCCVVLLAYSNIINPLREYLENKLNLYHLSLCSDGGEAYSVRYSSRHDFIAVTNFMYKNANLYLKRKHCKYLEALSYLS